MKAPITNDLEKDLESANIRIKALQKELTKCHAVRRLIVTAGLLSEDKFNLAEDLLDKDE